MLKIYTFLLFNFVFGILVTNGQNPTVQATTSVEVKLYMPAHLRSDITARDTLKVYLISEDSKKEGVITIVAKFERENAWSFELPWKRYFKIAYGIRDYSGYMVCVDNRQGEVERNPVIDILLENVKLDTEQLKFTPPCSIQD